MSKRLIAYDPITRTETWHEFDPVSRKAKVATIQDCKPIIERNKKLALTSEYAAHGKKECFYHIGTIPNTVLMEWKEKYNIDPFNDDDIPKIERLLQSNEYKYLRTVDKI